MGPPTFSAGVEAIRLDVLVTNGDRVVLGLEASDFEVRDNGILQDVELVSSEKLPLNSTSSWRSTRAGASRVSRSITCEAPARRSSLGWSRRTWRGWSRSATR